MEQPLDFDQSTAGDSRGDSMQRAGLLIGRGVLGLAGGQAIAMTGGQKGDGGQEGAGSQAEGLVGIAA